MCDYLQFHTGKIFPLCCNVCSEREVATEMSRRLLTEIMKKHAGVFQASKRSHCAMRFPRSPHCQAL